jgi:hypothetical protein
MMHLLAASPPFQTAHRQGSGWGRQRAGIRRGGVWRGGGQRAAAEDTCQRCDFPGSDFRGPRVGACRSRLEAGWSNSCSRFSIRRRAGSNLCDGKRGEPCP